MRSICTLAIAIAMVGAPAASFAQSGGLGGLLGSVLPNVGSVGASNAAGVLSYCVKNKLVNTTSASSVLGKITGQEGVKSSDGFQLGQSGTLQTDGGKFSLDSVKGKLKTQMCDMVLKHAKSFL